MTTRTIRQPKSIGIGAMLVGIGVGLYALYMFAFMVLPLGVETQARVINRFKEQDVSEWGRPRDTYHDVSVAQYTDASGAAHEFEGQGALPDELTVRYLSLDPEKVIIVTESTQFAGVGYGLGALVALGVAAQGGVWLFGRPPSEKQIQLRPKQLKG
jgi:hypothetical protein